MIVASQQPCDEGVIRGKTSRAVPKIFRALDSGGDDSRFQHGVYRWDCDQRGIACLAGQSRCLGRRCSMGHRELFALARRAVARRRLVRRSLRASSRFHDRSRHVLHCLSMVRICTEHQSTDCRARSAGIWRCLARARQPRDYQRLFSERRTGPGYWHLVRFHCHDCGSWARRRWMVNRAYFLARDFLH